ncbi:receptor-like protein 19 [Medicago truncatula]|uniref:Leucine-rich receptor-like kinase family protein n=2 Tax=Medicago truncatula TaxID=3880 RepID=A0A072VAL8_MEDTR|nr:receptor-like protein 19 [Medicago truncatula]KEH38656.1 leucine-rich receptor-like kinase family protein [Medicago truncatula]
MSLEFLNFRYNYLTGIIPQRLINSPSLKVLNLQMNTFHVSLNLYGNHLEGHFPKSLSGCKKLEFLNLGSNKIDDNFPYWLHTMQDLKVLVLRDNKLHGPIVNLKNEHLFPSLIIFDISGNNFSGFISKAYLNFFEAMKNVTQVARDSSLQYLHESYKTYASGYSDSVTMGTKGSKMTLVKIPRNFVSIDLSRNRFEGEIPNAIGELHALRIRGLNLSHNRLTDHIPQSMGIIGSLVKYAFRSYSANNFRSEEKFGYGCGFVIGIGIGYFMFLIGKPRWLVMIIGGHPKRRVKMS